MNYGNPQTPQHLQQQQQQYYQGGQQGGAPRFPQQVAHGAGLKQPHPSHSSNFQMRQTQQVMPSQQPSGVVVHPQQFPGQHQAPPIGYVTFTDDQRRSLISQLPAHMQHQMLNEKSLAQQDHILNGLIMSSRNRAMVAERQRQQQLQQASQTTPLQQQHQPPMHLQRQLTGVANQMLYSPAHQHSMAVDSRHGMGPQLQQQRVPGQVTHFRQAQIGQPYGGGGVLSGSMSAMTSSASQHNSPMSIPPGGPQSVGPSMMMAAVHPQQPKSIPPALGTSPQGFLSNSTGGPASVINSMRSVPSVPPPQSSYNTQSGATSTADACSPEYIATLNRLREYYDQCRRLINRLEIDVEYQRKLKAENPQETKLFTSVKRVLEIMEGKRVVDIKLLERLINNVRSSLISNNPSKGLSDIGRKLSLCDNLCPIKAALPDLWSSLRHLEIRNPASLASGKPVSKTMQEEGNGISPSGEKRVGNGTDATEMGVLRPLAEPTQKRTRKMEEGINMEERGEESRVGRGGEADWDELAALNKTLSDELRSQKLCWRVDSDHLPVTRENCSSIPLAIENKTSTNSLPLRLLVPFDYPMSSVRIPPASAKSTTSSRRLVDELRSRLDSDAALSKSVLSVIQMWTEMDGCTGNCFLAL